MIELNKLSKTLNLTIMLDTILGFVNAHIGSIMMMDFGDSKLRIIAAIGLEEKIIKETALSIGQGIAGKVLVYRNPVFLTSPMDLPELGIDINDFRRSEIKWSCIVPIYHKDKGIGVINIASLEHDSKYLHFLKIRAESLANIAKKYLLQFHTLDSQDTETEVMFDSLTGLYTYSYLWKRTIEEIARSYRGKYRFSILKLDIDGFKNINRKYGYRIGDKVLQKIGEWLKINLRSYSVIARTGGDKITILLPKTNKKDALKIAERIRKGIRKVGKELKLDIPLTVSQGISEFPEDGSNPEDLIEKAHEAIIGVKILGGDSISTSAE